MKFSFDELNSSSCFAGKEPPLLDILDSREQRQILQQECLKKHSCSLLSISLVSPGGIKNNLLYKYIFQRALDTVQLFLAKEKIKIIEQIIEHKDTGPYALFSLDVDALFLKSKMIEIEESLPITRLWDLDVINKEGKILSRTEINNHAVRKCLICNEHAKICAKKRNHKLQEILDKIQEIAVEDWMSINVEKLAADSLLKEVMLTPKPGLVDTYNSGAHRDMDLNTFIKSIDAIKSYFAIFFQKGVQLSAESPAQVFTSIRPIGIEAERDMLVATHEINTHKGSIFSFGLVITAIGYIYKNKEKLDIKNICHFVSKATSSILEELNNKNKMHETAGIKLYVKYNLTGARGEAAGGFKTITECALPAYNRFLDLDEKHRLLLTMLFIISVNDDTNVANRGGIEALKWIKQYAKNLLEDSKIYTDLKYLEEQLNIFDSICITKNISPGGCADLLALTYFFAQLP